MMGPTVEVVEFRLRPGVGEATFLEAVNASQRALAQLPGFLSRQILKGEDGRWIDLIHWRSTAEALAAAESFAALPEAAAFVAMIDADGMTLRHFGQVRAFLPA